MIYMIWRYCLHTFFKQNLIFFLNKDITILLFLVEHSKSKQILLDIIYYQTLYQSNSVNKDKIA